MSVVTQIQSCLRGFIDRRQLLLERNQQKMNLNYEYFSNIKKQIEDDAILKVMFFIRKLSRKKKLKRMSFMQEKHNAKGKKGKVANKK